MAPGRQREVAQIAWVDFYKRHPEIAERLAAAEREAALAAERRRAALAAEERAAAERAAAEQREQAELAVLRREAALGSLYSCRSEHECRKAFSLAQIYVNNSADMKIQLATDTIIETYNATEPGKIVAKATKVPGAGDSAVILFEAACHECSASGQRRAYVAMKGFKTFIAEKLEAIATRLDGVR